MPHFITNDTMTVIIIFVLKYIILQNLADDTLNMLLTSSCMRRQCNVIVLLIHTLILESTI